MLCSGTLTHVLLTHTAWWLHTSCSFISPLICSLVDHLTLSLVLFFLFCISYFLPPCIHLVFFQPHSLLLLSFFYFFCRSSLLSCFRFILYIIFFFGWLSLSSLSLFALHSVMFLQFVPKTHLFYTAGKDKKIKQWDADKFEHIQTLEVTCFSVLSIFEVEWISPMTTPHLSAVNQIWAQNQIRCNCWFAGDHLCAVVSSWMMICIWKTVHRKDVTPFTQQKCVIFHH